jgi:hypothetical protein
VVASRMGFLTSPTRAALTAGRTGCIGKVPRRYSSKNGTPAQNTLSSVYPICSGVPERERYRSPNAVMPVSKQNRSRRYGGEDGERVASPKAMLLCNWQLRLERGRILITRCVRTQIIAETPERISHKESGTKRVKKNRAIQDSASKADSATNACPFQTGGRTVFPMGSRRSSSTRKFVRGTLTHRKSLLRGLRRHARSSKTSHVMIAHGVMVPSHHTTVDVDIHSLCDFCVHGEGRGQRGLGSSRYRVRRRTQ